MREVDGQRKFHRREILPEVTGTNNIHHRAHHEHRGDRQRVQRTEPPAPILNLFRKIGPLLEYRVDYQGHVR